MKKRLEAFKAAKKIDQKLSNAKEAKKNKSVASPDIIEINDNSEFRWDNTEAREEKSMDPLDLIRKYVKLQRKMVLRGDKVFFRDLSVPGETLTKLKISKNPGEGIEHYTVGCLAYFIQNIHDDHPEYVRKCISENIKCVRRPDRTNVQQYLTGEKDFVLNLDNNLSDLGSGSTSHGDTGQRRSRRSRSRSQSRERRSRGRRSRSRSRDRSRSGVQYSRPDLSYGRSFQSDRNEQSRFSQRESRFDRSQSETFQTNTDFFVSQQEPFSQERREPFHQSQNFDQSRVRSDVDLRGLSHYQQVDQRSFEFNPFDGRNSVAKQMEYGSNITNDHNDRAQYNNQSDLGFTSVRCEERDRDRFDRMNEPFLQERNTMYGSQRDDDLEYDRGFHNDPSSDKSSGDHPKVGKNLGPMFVIGQSNNPPSSGRRW